MGWSSVQSLCLKLAWLLCLAFCLSLPLFRMPIFCLRLLPGLRLSRAQRGIGLGLIRCRRLTLLLRQCQSQCFSLLLLCLPLSLLCFLLLPVFLCPGGILLRAIRQSFAALHHPADDFLCVIDRECVSHALTRMFSHLSCVDPDHLTILVQEGTAIIPVIDRCICLDKGMDTRSISHGTVDCGNDTLGDGQSSSHRISDRDGTLADPQAVRISQCRLPDQGLHSFMDLIQRNLDHCQHAVLVDSKQTGRGKGIIVSQLLRLILFHAEANRDLLRIVHDACIGHDIQMICVPADNDAASRIRLTDLLLSIEEIKNRLDAGAGDGYNTGHSLLNHVRYIEGSTDGDTACLKRREMQFGLHIRLCLRFGLRLGFQAGRSLCFRLGLLLRSWLCFRPRLPLRFRLCFRLRLLLRFRLCFRLRLLLRFRLCFRLCLPLRFRLCFRLGFQARLGLRFLLRLIRLLCHPLRRFLFP